MFLENDMNRELLEYRTIAGMFFPVNNSIALKAWDNAKRRFTEDVWNAGFSGNSKGGPTEAVRAELALVGVKPRAVKGVLTSVKLKDEFDEKGNKYPKVRLAFDDPSGDTMVTLDQDSELAQRLVQKLLNVVPGEVLSFAPFSTLVNKQARVFANHVVSLKRADGVEVVAVPNLWTHAQASADEAERQLIAIGITDKELITKAKGKKKVEFHVAIYKEKICPQFETMPA